MYDTFGRINTSASVVCHCIFFSCIVSEGAITEEHPEFIPFYAPNRLDWPVRLDWLVIRFFFIQCRNITVKFINGACCCLRILGHSSIKSGKSIIKWVVFVIQMFMQGSWCFKLLFHWIFKVGNCRRSFGDIISQHFIILFIGLLISFETLERFVIGCNLLEVDLDFLLKGSLSFCHGSVKCFGICIFFLNVLNRVI